MTAPHIPVLYNETLKAFEDIEEGYIIDCTTGYAGHSKGLLLQNDDVKLICNDQDDEALAFSKIALEEFSSRVTFNKGNFEHIFEQFKDFEIRGILADIGVSSLQLDKKSRGFSFESETLDMRMDDKQELDASFVVNNYSQDELERVFNECGEVREYEKMASIVVNNRPFTSAKELAACISKNMHKGRIHPATLPFQGIRIEVNDELGVLKRLFDSLALFKPKNCIVAIISFHSLEDRIVKQYFKQWSKKCICPSDAFRCTCGNNNSLGKVLSKKPIIPSAAEIKINPRSRSSKLRIFKFD